MASRINEEARMGCVRRRPSDPSIRGQTGRAGPDSAIRYGVGQLRPHSRTGKVGAGGVSIRRAACHDHLGRVTLNTDIYAVNS